PRAQAARGWRASGPRCAAVRAASGQGLALRRQDSFASPVVTYLENRSESALMPPPSGAIAAWARTWTGRYARTDAESTGVVVSSSLLGPSLYGLDGPHLARGEKAPPRGANTGLNGLISARSRCHDIARRSLPAAVRPRPR